MPIDNGWKQDGIDILDNVELSISCIKFAKTRYYFSLNMATFSSFEHYTDAFLASMLE